jgi:hypothetical protein
MATVTFDQIKNLAFALPIANNDDNNAIQCMVIDAEESAMTMGGDPLAILESNLCFCEDYEVCKWFAENGVKF